MRRVAGVEGAAGAAVADVDAKIGGGEEGAYLLLLLLLLLLDPDRR